MFAPESLSGMWHRIYMVQVMEEGKICIMALYIGTSVHRYMLVRVALLSISWWGNVETSIPHFHGIVRICWSITDVQHFISSRELGEDIVSYSIASMKS